MEILFSYPLFYPSKKRRSPASPKPVSAFPSAIRPFGNLRFRLIWHFGLLPGARRLRRTGIRAVTFSRIPACTPLSPEKQKPAVFHRLPQKRHPSGAFSMLLFIKISSFHAAKAGLHATVNHIHHCIQENAPFLETGQPLSNSYISQQKFRSYDPGGTKALPFEGPPGPYPPPG